MVAPVVVSLRVTVCDPGYVPDGILKTGVAAGGRSTVYVALATLLITYPPPGTAIPSSTV
jgi:hypothetical protein